MSAMHRGTLLVRVSHRSGTSSHVCTRCAARYYHQQLSLRQKDDAATSDTSPSPAKPATRREGAKMASRIIQGLRSAAPGGFGKKQGAQKTDRPAAYRSIPIEQKSEDRHGPAYTTVSIQPGQIPNRRSTRPRRQSQKQLEGVDTHGNLDRSEQRRVAEPKDALVAKLRDDDNSTTDLKTLQKSIDMPLARQFLKGRLVRFVDEEQKKRVLKLAQEQANKHSDGKADVKFASLPQKYVEQLNKKAVAGSYEAIHGVSGKTPQEQIMTQIKTAMQLNGSYSSQQQEAVLGFMVKMWPAQKQARKARA